MYKISFLIGLALITLPFVAFAQTKAESDFMKFINRKIEIPDDIKYNCKWVYAVVVAQTDENNAVKSYHFINDVPSTLKDSFKSLQGYHFPASYKSSKQTVAFYFSIDNREVCKANKDDFTYIFPNDVMLKVSSAIAEAKKSFPKAIFLSEPVIKTIYETQH